MATSTLKGFLYDSPLLNPFMYGNCSLSDISTSCRKEVLLREAGELGLTRPEDEAIRFYYLNHLVSVIRKNRGEEEILTDLETEAVKLYETFSMQAAKRFFTYLTLICTRESRHFHNCPETLKEYKNVFGPNAYKFLKEIRGKNSETAVEHFFKACPEMEFGVYAESLVWVFENFKFSNGYGGKNWKNCAVPLHDFAAGRLSVEMLLDCGFTLAHNNGPIFNKGMVYSNYGSSMYHVLDVQRSGQIPQLINDMMNGIQYLKYAIEPEVLEWHSKFKSLLGKDENEHLDWFWVKKAGALHSVEEFVTKQKSLGIQSKHKDAPKFLKPKILDYVEVMPQMKLKKINRKLLSTGVS